MHIAIFGLSVTSCWGNGHATLWRALAAALGRRGHRITFFERDQHFYAAHRDLHVLPGHDLQLYGAWADIGAPARRAVRDADAAIVTSYCPDAAAASALLLDDARGVRIFYDMDTPVTLERLRAGERVEYLPPGGLGDFDLVLSCAGGPALSAVEQVLGARRAVPLHGCVDPDCYPPRPRAASPRAAVSYLATYADDRARAFAALVVDAARRRPHERFIVGGPKYPDAAAWPANIEYRMHVGQDEHLGFYGSARFTLNITRGPMLTWGHCPSGRLFEAAACGAPLISDDWPGLSEFFDPHSDLVVARGTDDVVAALAMDDAARARMATLARERVLDAATADVRAREFERAIESVPDASLTARQGS